MFDNGFSTLARSDGPSAALPSTRSRIEVLIRSISLKKIRLEHLTDCVTCVLQLKSGTTPCRVTVMSYECVVNVVKSWWSVRSSSVVRSVALPSDSRFVC